MVVSAGVRPRSASACHCDVLAVPAFHTGFAMRAMVLSACVMLLSVAGVAGVARVVRLLLAHVPRALFGSGLGQRRWL